MSTRAGQVAAARIERLRQIAFSTVPRLHRRRMAERQRGRPGSRGELADPRPGGTRRGGYASSCAPGIPPGFQRHRRHRHALRPAMSARRGFTLVELAVALVLALAGRRDRAPEAAPRAAPRPGAGRADGPERERARGGAGAGRRAGRPRLRRDHSRSLGRARLAEPYPERSPRRRAGRRHLSRAARGGGHVCGVSPGPPARDRDRGVVLGVACARRGPPTRSWSSPRAIPPRAPTMPGSTSASCRSARGAARAERRESPFGLPSRPPLGPGGAGPGHRRDRRSGSPR